VFEHLKDPLQRCLTLAARHVRQAAGAVIGLLKGLWLTHGELMESNALYRALVSAAAAAFARQIDLHRLVMAIVSALLTAYAAARRKHTDEPEEQYGHGWDDDPDGWSFT
jgi:hypothetical protein